MHFQMIRVLFGVLMEKLISRFSRLVFDGEARATANWKLILLLSSTKMKALKSSSKKMPMLRENVHRKSWHHTAASKNSLRKNGKLNITGELSGENKKDWKSAVIFRLISSHEDHMPLAVLRL